MMKVFLFDIKIKTDESTQKPVILDFLCIGVRHDIFMRNYDDAAFKSIKSIPMTQKEARKQTIRNINQAISGDGAKKLIAENSKLSLRRFSTNCKNEG